MGAVRASIRSVGRSRGARRHDRPAAAVEPITLLLRLRIGVGCHQRNFPFEFHAVSIALLQFPPGGLHPVAPGRNDFEIIRDFHGSRIFRCDATNDLLQVRENYVRVPAVVHQIFARRHQMRASNRSALLRDPLLETFSPGSKSLRDGLRRDMLPLQS